MTPASRTTCVVPKTTKPQVPQTTVLTPASTSSLLPRIPECVVSERQSSELPVVPESGDSSTITQYNLIRVQQQFGDVTVKGAENLNIGGTQNVATPPTKQEEEEKPLTAAQKIRKRTASRIQSWTKDMVETKSLKEVNEKLDRGPPLVTIKGRPGEGKSTTAYMALKDQYNQGRQVYQVVSPKEFNEVIMACSNPVILLDDIFGDLEFDTGEWAKWRPSLRPIVDVKHADQYAENVPERPRGDDLTQLQERSPNKNKAIIILVGRDYVLKSSLADLGRMADYISSPQYVVDVSSQRGSYERRKIWRVHAEAKHIDLDESTVSQICEADCPHGFAHVCKMFATAYEKDWTQLQVQMFFEAPLDFLRKTLDKCLQDVKKRSLFMAMIKRDGKISGQEMEEEDSLGYECRTAADDLVGSYLKKEDDTYMFDHPSIYDSVSFILSTKLSKFVIENCSLLFIHQRLRLAPSKEGETNVASKMGIVANISWTYAGHLARRFACEIQRSNFFHVLSHQALCNSDFVDLLMVCLKTQFHMHLTNIVKLTDITSRQSFCELLPSSKSHHLIKILMEKENISFNRREGRDILLGVCNNAASSVLKYVSEHIKLYINAKWRGLTPLMLAAETRDSVFVNQVLSLNPDLNARDDEGKSAFYYLCKNGLTSAVEYAIDKGVDVNEHHGLYEHPIYLAIEEGHLQVVKLLVNRGCNIDNQKSLGVALQNGNEKMVQFFLNRGAVLEAIGVCTACEVGELNVVKMLFEKDATVNMKTSKGNTPLLSSCKGNPNVVSYLVKKGACVNKALYITGDTALHIAASRISSDVMDVLLKAGADFNVQNNTGDTPLHGAALRGSTECVDVLLKAGANVNVQNGKHGTPLHTAAGQGSTECVGVLLKAGANVNVQNNTSDTPLHKAAGQGSTECVDVLLKAGANVNVQNDARDTPLHRAAGQGYAECVDVLLKARANVNIQNNTSETPFHIAIDRLVSRVRFHVLLPETKCVDTLLKAGADVNLQNESGYTPLHTAVQWRSPWCIDVLLKAGADVNVQNETGDTQLHLAAEWGSTDSVYMLLKAGGDANVHNNTGETPLHRAAHRGLTECVDVLLKTGADGNVQNDAGDTSLHIATRQEPTDCIDVLLKARADVNVQNDKGDTPLLQAVGRGSTDCVDKLLKARAKVNVQNNTGDTPLLQAAARGSTECVDKLLKARAKVNVQNNTGDTPLLQAAVQGSAECVSMLLKTGADVNVQNNTGDTSLHKAAEQGSAECVDKFLRAGADVNVQNNTGDTPLLQATGRGSTECVDKLLKARANVNVQNNTGDTPLLQAAERGSAKCVSMLLKTGADFNVQNNTGNTSLHRAAEHGSIECVDKILRARADVNVQNNTGDTPLLQAAGRGSAECVNLLLQNGADVNVQNDTGDTPLHTAAEWGFAECADLLLKAGADINVQNNTGDTPLHAAEAAMQGSEETVCLLLKAGADVNVQNYTGDTPLHIASGLGSTQCVDVLLKAGADVKVQNNTGDTPLHTTSTAAMRYTDIHLLVQPEAFGTLLATTHCFDVLLKAGASVNTQNNTGDTPLHKAVGLGSPECLYVLLNAGADVNVPNNTGDTPLHVATLWESRGLLYVLLEAGADVNVQNDTGDTPLHKAAGRGFTKCVDVLLKAGADVNIQNNTGDTPLHKAVEWGSTESVDVLLNAGADINILNSKSRTPLGKEAAVRNL